jgi:hypothetical protein
LTQYFAGDRPRALPESGRRSARTRWWETPYGRWRVAAETEAMRRFPEFRAFEDAGGNLGWAGALTSALLPRTRYLVRVTYPSSFPDDAPAVEIVEPELADGTPHRLSPQRPCLYRETQGPRHGYDPGHTTAATVVAWTALWIHAYETWRATGRWPGKAE